MIKLTRLVSTVILGTVLAVACDDGSTIPDSNGTTGRLYGHVFSLTDTAAIAGASVSLIDPVPCRVIAGPVITDDTGYYNFPDIPAGDWCLFVIEGNHLFFNPGAARVSIEPGQTFQRDARMIRSGLWDDDGAKFAGTVTDAQTGDPITGAFVSAMMMGISNSFVGVPLSEAITDSLGHYQITVTTWFLDFSTFQVVHPFGVTREGYAPHFVLDVPDIDATIDTVYTLDVALTTNSYHGVIKGRVQSAGKYLAGVPVGLDYSTVPVDSLFEPSSKDDGGPQPTSLLGSAVYTDGAGRFSIGGLAPGTYFVDVAFLADDGFVRLPSSDAEERQVIVELGPDEVIDVGTVQLAKAIRPLAPANGTVVTDTTPLLSWNSAPGANEYRISLGTSHLLSFSTTVTSPSYQLEMPIPPGRSLRWIVTALNGNQYISTFEAVATFTVAP